MMSGERTISDMVQQACNPRAILNVTKAHRIVHCHADDFDLPTHDFDSDTDEARAVPKRNDEEKWTELCLDEFLHPSRRNNPR